MYFWVYSEKCPLFRESTVNNLNDFNTESLRTPYICETLSTWNVLLTLVLPVFLCPVVKEGTPVRGNDEVERNLVLVENVAYFKGLSPEAVSVMLEFVMRLRMGKNF